MSINSDGFHTPLVGSDKNNLRKYTEDEVPSKEPPRGSNESLGGDTGSTRLATRKHMFNKRRLINDVAFALAVIGFILMIVETELFMQKVFDRQDTASIVIKSCITVTTVMLLFTVLCYNYVDWQLYMYTNSIEVNETEICTPVQY